MRRLRAAAGTLVCALGYTAVTVTVVALAPLALVGGELVNRHYLGSYRRIRPCRPGRAARPRGSVRVSYLSWLRQGPGWEASSLRSGWLRVGVVPAAFLTNPAWIALTGPARWLTRSRWLTAPIRWLTAPIGWLLARLRPAAGRRRGNGPPPAGVREPRRPRPGPPAGAIELPEPR